MIYLDNAATTFPKPEVVYETMDKANRGLNVNAGRGSYRIAKEASQLINETKELLRSLVGDCDSSAVILAPSVTIAINQIVQGILWRENSTVYLSPYEHNAVARSIYKASKDYKFSVKLLPIKEKSLEIDLEKMKIEFHQDRPFAVFCTHISNVTGYILPISKIFKCAKEYNAITVLDAAQSLGLIDFDVTKAYVDILAFAGHKNLFGPLGVGGFINVKRIPLKEFITGGTGSDSLNLEMPNDEIQRYEAASANIVAIAGLSAALKCIDIRTNYEKDTELTRYLVESLSTIDELRLHLPESLEDHIGIVSFTVEGFDSNDIGQILDEDYDIAVRTGYHCAPFIHDYLNDKQFLGTVRVGLSKFNTRKDIDMLVNAMKEIIE